MERERAKRLVSAGVAAAVITLCFLIAVVGFQIARLIQTRRELNSLRETVRQYEKLNAETEDEIRLWQEEWKIEEAARKYGFRRNN